MEIFQSSFEHDLNVLVGHNLFPIGLLHGIVHAFLLDNALELSVLSNMRTYNNYL